MIENIFIKILVIIFIGVIIYLIYNFYNEQSLQKHLKCNLNDYNIDNIVVIKRTPEYSKLIDNIIDDKNFIFTEKELSILKNPQQIFNVTNNSPEQIMNIETNEKDNVSIKNISNDIYLNCKKDLQDNTFDFNNDNDENIEMFISNDKNNLIDVSSKEYNNIKNMLQYDIKKLIGPNCFNTGVLKKNIPLIKNYLKNYYQDIYGNKIDAELEDYFTAYYTLINNDDNVGLPVNTLIGNSDFVIPDQYKYDSHFTNAYNIDWNRIINPIGYSQ